MNINSTRSLYRYAHNEKDVIYFVTIGECYDANYKYVNIIWFPTDSVIQTGWGNRIYENSYIDVSAELILCD